MKPLSVAAFTRHYRRLGPEERAAFVASLWAASGWETRVAGGDTVVASSDGVERRIRLFDPGPFRSPSLEPDDGGRVDVLVVGEDAASARDAAANSGVRYVTPSDLRDRVLYGLPRDEAAALVATHLGTSLEAAEDAESEGGFGVPTFRAPDAFRRRLPDPGRAAAVVVLFAVVVVAIIAPGAFSFSAGDAPAEVPTVDGTFTPGTVGAIGGSPTESATDGNSSGMPPGLAKNEVRNATALASATTGAMAESGWVLRASRTGPDRTAWLRGGDRWSQEVRVQNETVYRSRTRTWHDGENRTVEIVENVYKGGDTLYVRQEGPDGVLYAAPTEHVKGVDSIRHRVHNVILAYLSTDDTSVTCVATLEGSGECFAYRVVAIGTPDLLPTDAENYSATATVSDVGVVTSLHVQYTVPDPDESGDRSWVRFGFDVAGVGTDVTVEAPSWLDEAKERTAPSATATTEGRRNSTDA